MRRAKNKKSFEEFFENEVMAPWDEALLKSNEELLSEFAGGTLNEAGLHLLNMRGYRDQLLSMCSSAEEREGVWFDFLLNEQIQTLIERDTPISREEAGSIIVSAEQKASKLARSH